MGQAVTSDDNGKASNDFEQARNDEQLKLRYAFWFALAALFALVVVFVIGSHEWSDDIQQAAAVISPVAGVVGTIAGAYLGHQAGSAGREREAAERRELLHRLLGDNTST